MTQHLVGQRKEDKKKGVSRDWICTWGWGELSRGQIPQIGATIWDRGKVYGAVESSN